MNARNTQIRPFTFHSFYRPQNTQHFIIPRAINFKSWNFAMKIWVSYINCLFTWIHSLIISMRQAKPRWHESFIWSKCSFSMMNIFLFENHVQHRQILENVSHKRTHYTYRTSNESEIERHEGEKKRRIPSENYKWQNHV